MRVGRIIGFRQASEGQIHHIDREQPAERWAFGHIWQRYDVVEAIDGALLSDWTAPALNTASCDDLPNPWSTFSLELGISHRGVSCPESGLLPAE